jgi:hypothetical protein
MRVNSQGWVGGFWKSITRRCQALRTAWTKDSAKSRRHRRSGLSQMATLEQRTLLAAFVVNSAADNTTAGDGLTTLREAIALANANAGADTITFGNGAGVGGTNFTDATPDTIALSLGQMSITESVTITGRGATTTIIDAQQSSRVFDITNTAGNVTIESLALKNGRTTGSGTDFADPSFSGGAIRSRSLGTLAVSRLSLTNNSTAGNNAFGGAIFSERGAVSIQLSTVSGNSTAGQLSGGGAIASRYADITVNQSQLTSNSTTGMNSSGGSIWSSAGRVLITASTLSGNSTSGNSSNGGAVFSANGGLTVVQSTLSGNTTQGPTSHGGAIYSRTPLNIHQSTISTNSTLGADSDGGGAFGIGGEMTVFNSTITNNAATGRGGGIGSLGESITIRSSIVAGNTDNGTAPDIQKSGSLTITYSLVGKATGTELAPSVGNTADQNSNFIGSAGSPITPRLGPLQNNGGGVLTHSLLPGSLALNHGDNTQIPLDTLDLDGDLNTSETVPYEQRGVLFSRVFAGTVDMGAFESQSLNLVVDTSVDENDGNYAPGNLSLREAILLANANPGADTIAFGDGSTFGGTNFTDGVADTITLSLGEMSITESLVITGLNADKTIIDANNASRILKITSTAGDVALSGLTLRNGRTTGDNSGLSDYTYRGGAIHSTSTGALVIRQSILSGNSTTGALSRGGAIFSLNTVLNISQSTLSGNSTTGDQASGGAIYAQGGTLTVSQSTLSGNSTAGWFAQGGAICATTTSLTVSQSTLNGNSTTGNESRGGAISAIYAGGLVTVSQSTLSGNTTAGSRGYGGAIFINSASFTLSQSTLTGNHANLSEGGGIMLASSPVTIRNSIIAGNTDNGAAPDIRKYASTPPAVSHSMIGDNTGTGLTEAQTADGSSNFIGSSTGGGIIDPHLGSLANNGGPTQTHALLAGSLALNHGNNSLIPVDTLDIDGDSNTTEVVPFDQRGVGFARIGGGTVDMGALEAQPPVVALANTVVSLAENTSTSSHIRVADIVITHDGLGTNTLTLTGADAAAFEIVGNQLFLKSGVALNFEAKSAYQVTVNVDDARFPTNPDSSVNFTLTLTNVAEAPAVSGPLSFSFEEFSPRWTFIGKLNATDSDGDSLSYSIISGNFDNTLFIGDGAVPGDGGRLWVYQQDLTGLRQRGMFNLKVRVTDNSTQALFTEVDVKVFILPSQSGSKKLTPSVDGAVRDAGGNGFDSGDTVNSTGTGMLVQGGATPSRGVMEFDLRSLPTNRALKSAWLFFSTSALAGGATVNVPIDIFGYAGNGALSAADATQGTKIGARPISNADGSNQLKIHSAPLDTNYVRTLIGNGQLGLVLRNDTTSDGVVINTSESSVSGDQKPYLVLQFGDLQPDLFIRDNGATGPGNQFLTLGSNGSSFTVNTANVFAAGSWERFLTGDFNGDGRTDIAGRLSTDGTWWISLANTSGIHQAATQWGSWSPLATWNDVLVADFDGDGKADIAGRVASGDWWVSRSTGSVLSAKLWGNWSSANTWSNVNVGDFNRDGRMDIAGRNNLGEWFVSRSTGTTPANAAFASAKWGQWSTLTSWSDVQIGDFNGDGRSDIAGRSSIGQWWVNRSTGTTFGAAQYYGLWSTNTTWSDVRVADFNGDGRDDILGRSTIGQWWVAETAVTSSFTMKFLGQRTAPQSQWGEMVVGDFNRDGRADIATRNTVDNTVWVSLWTITGNTPSFVTTNWATLPTAGGPAWRLLKSGRLNG